MFETERLIIKAPDEVTAEERLHYFSKNREFFERFTPARVDEYYTKERQIRALENEILREKNKAGAHYYYFRKEEPEIITGTIIFSGIRMEPFYSTVLGYDQDEDRQGEGYCTEGCRAAMEDLLKKYRIHRIEARVLPENVKSIHILERLQFFREGTEKAGVLIAGEYKDHYRYAFLNEQ